MAAGDVDVKITTLRAIGGNLFDGVDDYVEIPHSIYQLGANLANGFTISAWINPRTSGELSSGGILQKGSSNIGLNGFIFKVNSDTAIGVKINASATKNSGNNMTLNVWNHVLCTINSSSQVSFYINGVLSGAANQQLAELISTITDTGVMRIGNSSVDTSTSFNGTIANVKMWNRVLTATDIANDYAGSIPTTGLIHRFRLNGDYTDYGSVGVTATNSGSIPAVVDDAVATVIKAQRATAGATGKYNITSSNGQIISTAITE